MMSAMADGEGDLWNTVAWPVISRPWMEPPAPLWRDDTSGLEVYVNGALVELSMGDGWSGRLDPDEAAAIPGGLAVAIEAALVWSARWDTSTRTYKPVA